MADKGSRDGNSRRPSFRKTVADASIPGDYLDSLEQKRRQLDESIHKYIAAKEREYKVYERDLRQQLKLVQHDGDKESSDKARMPDSAQTTPKLESRSSITSDTSERNEHNDNVLLVDGKIVQMTSANAVNHRRSQEHDQEFVGLFTPSFLPALGSETSSVLLRTSSEPPIVALPMREDASPSNSTARSRSDPVAAVKSKRPSSLHLAHRTSSSGSSADGKLASALKSPTHSTKPKGKRVSLAVGDAIVAPSDSVPLAMSNNSTPSHSRTRSSVLISENVPAQIPETLTEPQSSSQEVTSQTEIATDDITPQASGVPQTTFSPQKRSPVKQVSKIDPDGDLFDLEDENIYQADDDPVFGNPFETEDDVVGRLDRVELKGAPPSQSPEVDYDDDAGLVPDYDEDDDHIDFGPSSATASQQPTSPGFRRPSVSMDPVYAGVDWERAERDAVMNEVYGSKYTRPGSKSSFTAGSLGESYMARNSENLIKNRAGQRSTSISK